MKRLIATLFLTLTFSGPAFSQSEALHFITIDRNPSTQGLSSAGFSSLRHGTAYSVFSNPAAIPLASHSFDAAASYTMWAPETSDLSNVAFGASYKINEKFGVAAGFALQSYEKIQLDGEAFAPSDILLGIGAGYELTANLSVGVNLRYAMEKMLPEQTLSAFNADIFAMYRGRMYDIAGGFAGIGGKVSDAQGNSFCLPSSFRLAGDYLLPVSTKTALQLLADADYFFSGELSAAAAVEFTYDRYHLRTAYRFATEAAAMPSHLSLGVGADFKGFRIDLSYLTLSETLSNSFGIGLAYCF